jgi:hypothetical protein
MRIGYFRGVCEAVLLGAACMTAVAQTSVAGEYVCASIGSRPCDTSTELQLTENGNWRWGRYSGTYSGARGSLAFDGLGGPATWGPAAAGRDTLTFGSRDQRVVWQKPSPGGRAGAGLAPGVYFCRTAPGGCQTAKGIEIAADGTWSWGASGGSYSIVGGRVVFHGPQVSSWGPAEVGDRKLIFRSPSGDSEWIASSASPAGRPVGDPSSFDLGCPMQPFDRQRAMSSVQDASAPGASSATKAAAHQQLANFCRKAGDVNRAEQETLKAQYWMSGGY